jgi:hypothetical protein
VIRVTTGVEPSVFQRALTREIAKAAPSLFLIMQPKCWIVGKPSIILSPSAKLGLDADAVIHRGLNSLLAAEIAFSGLH